MPPAQALLKGLSPQESIEIFQLIKYSSTLFNLSHSLEGCDPRFSHHTRCPRFAAVTLVLTDALHASDLLPKMRIRFGTILPILMKLRMNENTVWTDSQDYGADEILSHPFILTPPVQRAACALHFEGSVPTRINRNHPINQISIYSF